MKKSSSRDEKASSSELAHNNQDLGKKLMIKI